MEQARQYWAQQREVVRWRLPIPNPYLTEVGLRVQYDLWVEEWLRVTPLLTPPGYEWWLVEVYQRRYEATEVERWQRPIWR
jgi:hypothetical protein